MIAQEKILQLQGIIRDQLTPLIDHDYWLLSVPHHTNVGDTLIWQGTMDFLNTLPYKCKGISSYYCEVPKSIKADDIIIFNGGGCFGDLWPNSHIFRMKVVEKYPNNKIIFLPQTVWFEDENNLKDCVELLSHSHQITICARDSFSYELLKKNFSNNILLVPDTAFYINMNRWKRAAESKGTLLLLRRDKELKLYPQIEELKEQDITITEWLPMCSETTPFKWLRRLRKYFKNYQFLSDWYAYLILRPYLINSGIQLISSHKKIYSTRLHAAILSVLLDKAKDLTWFDNSYGKNLHFYKTWLQDCDGIEFIE